MKGNKIKSFMQLAGQPTAERLHTSNETQRKLAAQLLLSETLEYVIHGLGVTPEFNGTKITAPNDVEYSLSETAPDPKEMVDGLADVAYTMYWMQHLNVTWKSMHLSGVQRGVVRVLQRRWKIQ